MRFYIPALLAAVLAAASFLPAAQAAPVDTGWRAELMQKADYRSDYRGGYVRRGERWGYGANCRELRRACMYKRELGEEGMGNCQRYREMCR